MANILARYPEFTAPDPPNPVSCLLSPDPCLLQGLRALQPDVGWLWFVLKPRLSAPLPSNQEGEAPAEPEL